MSFVNFQYCHLKEENVPIIHLIKDCNLKILILSKSKKIHMPSLEWSD